MPRLVKKDTTSVTDYIFVQDATDGSPETGAAITGFDIQYVRSGVAPEEKVDATALAATDSVFSANKMIEIDATDQPGLYRVDWPDAMFSTGVSHVVGTVKATGFQPVHREFQLVDFDPDDAVRAGLTSLPNAVADGSGGLPISDAGGLDLDAQLAATNEVTAARMAALTDWIDGQRLDLLLDAVKAVTDVIPDAGALTTIGADTARLTAARAQVLTDWANAGRLDAILDIIAADVVNLDGDAMRGTDSAATAAALATAQTDLDTLTGADGATLATAQGLYAPAKAADVNTEVSDVLKTDTITDLTNGIPPDEPTLEQAVMYLYSALKNKIDVDSGFKEYYNGAGVIIWKKALSDDASNYIEAEGEAGT